MKNRVLKKLITTLFLILPFLDMLRTTEIRHFEIFGISCIELINILLIGMSLFITIIKIFKDRKKHLLYLFLFIIISGIYMIFHYQNLMKFNTNLLNFIDFNFIRESFYIFRVYMLPIFLLFILLENKDIFDGKYYLNISKLIIFIISFSIIILDIFKLSYISYSDTNNFVERNLFDYFLYQGDWKLLSARGWFDSANELSAILLMLFPVNIYLLYKEKKKTNYCLYIMQFLAMILLGTRTSAYGALLVSIVLLIGYIVYTSIRKEKYNSKFLKDYVIMTLTLTIYLVISPFMLGQINDSNYDFSIQNMDAYKKLQDTNEELDQLIKQYASEYLINPVYFDYYPIQNDTEFWLKIANRDRVLNSNDRNLKIEILNRVKERNNNKMDKYLGMGYTLGFIDFERDYIYQYYILGLFGILLFIVPYFIVLIYNIIKVLFNLKKNFKYITLISIMSPCLILLAAYFSGHVFVWVCPMMNLVLSLGLLNVIVDENYKKV